MESRTPRRHNGYLLLEVALILALLILAILLYWRPASDGDLRPNWWNWPTLAVLFFSIVALHTWRRKRAL